MAFCGAHSKRKRIGMQCFWAPWLFVSVICAVPIPPPVPGSTETATLPAATRTESLSLPTAARSSTHTASRTDDGLGTRTESVTLPSSTVSAQLPLATTTVTIPPATPVPWTRTAWSCRGALCRALGARPPEEQEEEDDGSLASAQIGILIWFLLLLILIGAAAFLFKQWKVLDNAMGKDVMMDMDDALGKAEFLKNDPKKRLDPLPELQQRSEMYSEMLRIHGQELTLVNGPLQEYNAREAREKKEAREKAEKEREAAEKEGKALPPADDIDAPLPLKETVDQIGATLAVLEDDVNRQRRALREHVI